MSVCVDRSLFIERDLAESDRVLCSRLKVCACTC